MTWNIQGSKETDLGRVAEIVSDAATDAVVLQEVRRPQADRLADELGMASVWHEKHHPLRPFRPGRAEGAAILTPHTLLATDHARVSDASALHSYRRRIVQWGVVERPNRSSCRVVNVHLSPHDLAAERRVEAERIAELVDGFGGRHPVVVAGDFNDAGTSEIVDILPGIEVFAPPPTNPSDDPIARIDHVLVPPSASRTSVSAPSGGPAWSALSDHLPLTVRFTLVETMTPAIPSGPERRLS